MRALRRRNPISAPEGNAINQAVYQMPEAIGKAKMQMTPTEIIPWLTLFLSSIAVLGHVKGWVNSGEKKLSEDLVSVRDNVAKHDKTLIDHDRRIQAAETDIKHLPDKDTVNDLKLALTEMNGRFGTLSESVSGISRTVHRIDDYLRIEGKG